MHSVKLLIVLQLFWALFETGNCRNDEITMDQLYGYGMVVKNVRKQDMDLYNCTANGYCPPFSWENCMNDTQSFRFIEYSHSPDPLIIGESGIIRKFAINGQTKEVKNLMEKVYIYEELSDGSWHNYFNNTFDICGSGVYPLSCPIPAGKVVNLTSAHDSPTPPARSYMAIEHYFDSSYKSPIIGCVVAYWESVPN